MKKFILITFIFFIFGQMAANNYIRYIVENCIDEALLD